MENNDLNLHNSKLSSKLFVKQNKNENKISKNEKEKELN